MPSRRAGRYEQRRHHQEGGQPMRSPITRRSRRPGWLSWLDRRAAPYLLVAPFFLIFGVFGAYPLLRTAWMSLHKWDLVNDRTRGHTFVGLSNYVALVHDDYFWNAVL